MIATYTFMFFLTALIFINPDASVYRRASPPRCFIVAPVERLKTAKAVFSGQVIEVNESEGTQVVKFSVFKSWKYVRAGEVTLTNFIHHEGPYFHQGKSYLVYAYEREGKLSSGACSGTLGVEDARDEMIELDKWKARNKSQGRAKT